MNPLPKHGTNWNKLAPPLRPTAAVGQTMRDIVGDGKILLLGVTPELHAVFDDIVAIDKDHNMIFNVWPGNTPTKTAMTADWESIDIEPNSLSGVVGDGAISMLGSLSRIKFMQERVWRWLKPGGVFVHRGFERPDYPVTSNTIAATASTKADINWHAFKLMMFYNIAGKSDEPGIVPLADVKKLFDAICPDRDRTCAITGWPRTAIDTIDLYDGIPTVTVAPDRQQWIDMIPRGAVDIRFTPTTGYDLAETCPIMSWRKP